MALTADAKGVLVRLHSTQGVCNPSTVISERRESAPASVFFTSDCLEGLYSDWLFDLALKRVRVVVVRVRVVVVRVRVKGSSG